MLDSGDNIKVPAGKYRIYVNLNNSAAMTYELNAEDYGVPGRRREPEPEGRLGTSTDRPWPRPTGVAPDGERQRHHLRLPGLERRGCAATPQFLFKNGDETQWIGADASLAGGDGMYTCTIGTAFAVSANKVNAVITEAGTYDYWLLLPEAGRAYVMAAGEKPLNMSPRRGAWWATSPDGGEPGRLLDERAGRLLRPQGRRAERPPTSSKIRFNLTPGTTRPTTAPPSGGDIDINTAVAVISSGGSPQNMKVQLDGTYDIYFDLANSTVYVMSQGRTPCRRTITTPTRDGALRLRPVF